MKYSIFNDNGIQTLILEDEWNDDLLQIMDDNSVRGLWINVARGFDGKDIEFIKRIPHLEYLSVSDFRLSDVSPINNLTSLRQLVLGHGKYKGIDFETLPNLVDLWADKIINAPSVAKCVSLEKLSMGSYLGKDLTALRPLINLQRLQLRTSPTVSLNGLESLRSLTRLELRSLTKLTDIRQMTAVPNVSIIDMTKCRKVETISPLENLIKLRRLNFSGCANIASLAPVENLTELIDLIFYDDTNIVDGDLDPLLALKKLEFTMFKDMPHYNHRSSEFPRSATCQIGCAW